MEPANIIRTNKPTVFIFKNLHILFSILEYSIFETGLFITGYKYLKVKSNEKKTSDKRFNIT
jgi:hypothetical protein